MRHKYFISPNFVSSLPNHQVNWMKVYQYAKKMEQGETFPPVHIFYNGDRCRWDYHDGRHRVIAAKLIGVCLWVTSSRRMGNPRK